LALGDLSTSLSSAMREHYDAGEVRAFIQRLVDDVARSFDRDRPLHLVGIRTRGETLAERVAMQLRDRHGFAHIGRGVLDITLYRDDLSEIGPRPLVRPTHLAIDINNVPMVLVDDVIFTGRTARAALDALSDFGRPSAIRLAVLVDRGGRELPIQPDFCALRLGELARDLRVKVRLTERDGADEIIVGPRTS
jgi:pyrimidine operon attenuation protein/uracil phosphoribosyltransferase